METIISEARKEVSRVLSEREQIRETNVKDSNNVTFDISSIPIKLISHNPTALSADEITKQLNKMGLDCKYTQGELLKMNIDYVHKKIGNGPLQSFGIFYDEHNAAQIGNLPDNVDEALTQVLMSRFINKAFGNYVEEGWSEHSFGKYSRMLAVIQQKDNFDYLIKNFTDFTYAKSPEYTMTENATTVEAIRQLFIDCAQRCTSAAVEGITKATLDAAFSNTIDSLNESDLESDYEATGNRMIFLLKNYDGERKEADGVGVVTCDWHILIKNYREKKSEIQHETTITTSARSVLYTDAELLEKHYNSVMSREKALSYMIGTNNEP